MIKRTLFFGNPAYLSTEHEQLVVETAAEPKEKKTVPIEDIGMIVLENRQITITTGLLAKLVDNNVAVVTCNQQYLPSGMMLNLEGHSELTERHLCQLDSSLPLKKNLWQQTVQAKIRNQAAHLLSRGLPMDNMLRWAGNVASGDTQNLEARAAAYYWDRLYGDAKFTRHRFGPPPNHLLNYGYAILRGVCARALVGSGLFPAVGIHHRNKYNPFCLADDIMEPYRPYVDNLVGYIMIAFDDFSELTTPIKKELLQVPTLDVNMEGNKSPLMVAMSRTTNSLYECFAGLSRKIIYPEYG